MPRYLNPSPSQPFLAGLFGQGVRQTGQGAFRLDNRAQFAPTGPALFGAAGNQSINDYLTLGGSNAFTNPLGAIGRTGDFSMLPEQLRRSYEQAGSTLDQLIGSSRPIVDAMIQTGMPVDIGSVVRAAQSRFNNVLMPDIAERYNPAQGTDFQNIAAREAGLLETELGALDYEANEAARARQMEALTVAAPTLAGLSADRMGLEGAALDELGAMSEATDPGARLFNSLLQLLGYTQQTTDLVRNATPAGTGGSGTAEMISGLANPIGSIMCWVADELFGADDPRAHAARRWCHAHLDHPFVQQYAREGEGWAAWLRENAWAKRLVAPAWEWMAERGMTLAEAR